MRVVVTDTAKSQLQKLSKSVQKQIAKKFLHVEASGLTNVLKVKSSSLYRIRISNYRAIGSLEANIFIVLYIGHRSSVYRELQ